MKAVVNHRQKDFGSDSHTCQILIMCEDFAAYERAEDVCWRIITQLPDDLDFSFNCWNFQELTDTASMDSAVRCATISDVIIISLHKTELGLMTEQWLQSIALARRDNRGVLALVLNEIHDTEQSVNKLFKRLSQSAQKFGMDFLASTPSLVNHLPLVTGSLAKRI